MSRMLNFLLALITLLSANLASAASTNPSKVLRLNKIDPRTISNVTVEVSYAIDGAPHYDYEVVGNWNKFYSLEIRQTAGTLGADGFYRGDFLHLTSSGSACTSNCTMTITKTEPRTITDVTVGISFSISGYTHYDYETVAMPGAPPFIYGENFTENLNVDGRGMTWDGYQYVGDILSTPTQQSGFYWDTNQIGYNGEIWVEGFSPNSSADVYYDSPSFGSEYLFGFGISADGIGHGVYQTDDCLHLRMRYNDIFSPQQLRVVDGAGRSVSFTTNSLRPCSYQP